MKIRGLYAMWYREAKVFIRERSRVISSIVNPLLWLLILGGGLGSTLKEGIDGVEFMPFIYPGVLIQSVLFSSIFFGVYIVWDKKIDFLKEVLVSPLSRTTIFAGKVLGGSTDTFIQVAILLGIGVVFTQMGLMPGLQLTPTSIAISLLFLMLTTFAAVSIGLTVGSQMESPEGFQLIGSFVIFPMFFLSGAFFSIKQLPWWLAPFVYVNPITYSVDAIRGAMTGVSAFTLEYDLMWIASFAVIMILLGTQAFKRMKV